jgi:PhzF family phenazine biosynthesis protein
MTLADVPIFQVDAFTDKPFAGNPAAVCILSAPRDDRWMQNVATEMNLSETAFLIKQRNGYNLRWFTPKVEVDLCGHATLASAHILWETNKLESHEKARFHTRSGLLTAQLSGDWIEMDFPKEASKQATAPDNLSKALGIAPKFVGMNRFDYLIEVESEAIVRNMKPQLHTAG